MVLSGVNKHFGTLHVLQDIEMTVHKGEVVVVLGPSGSGKSTLCRAINRLETIGSGTITIDGVPLPEEGRALARLRADVGMVFQSFNLFAHKTVLENITLGPIKVRGLKPAEASQRAMELLERVGVGDQAEKYPAQLSGGQQQRVAVARSLANDPSIVLADEPTGILDLTTGEEIIELLRMLSQERGVTVISATHDYKMLNVSDRVVWVRDGQVDRIERREELDISIGSIGEKLTGHREAGA